MEMQESRDVGGLSHLFCLRSMWRIRVLAEMLSEVGLFRNTLRS